MIELNIFEKKKLIFLPDAIINLSTFIKKKNVNFEIEKTRGKKIIFSAGRLTKQKNFSYLIDEFLIFVKLTMNLFYIS